MFNVSAIRRLRREHNLTEGGDDDDEAEVSSLLMARGMDTGRLWRETMHTKKGMIKEASSHVHAQLVTSRQTLSSLIINFVSILRISA